MHLDRILPRILAIAFVLLGIVFLVGGIRLAIIGGSLYYCLAGISILIAGVTLWIRNRWGLWTYGVLMVGTALWAVWEVGLNPWAMLPRLGLLSLLGALLLLPVMRRTLSRGPATSRLVARAAAAIAIAIPCTCVISALLAGHDGEAGERLAAPNHSGPGGARLALGTDQDWSSASATLAGARFSNLKLINPENVRKLRVAWRYKFGETVPNGLEVTPIKIDDTLYACNGSNIVVALDAASGRERWRFDPQVDLKNVPFAICRGVTYYKVPSATGACAERIFTNTVDARLIAVDARTGQRCEGFGRNGEISLLEGMGDVPKGYYFPSSAPTLARGRLVIGGLVVDGQYWGEPSGVIRAFDALTGQLSWAYDAGRPDLKGLPAAGQSYTLATPNAWAPMSYDDALGLVYIPTGVATPDHYGARRRPFDDEISSAIMALSIEDGSRRWLFQTVHHDLWDYDVASQPVLVDLASDHGVIKALLQPTKRGETFLLDRATGQPLDKVMEKPVSQLGVAPGERLSPTQPFPTSLPSLSGRLLTEKMMWGLTPFDQMWCRIKFRQARYEGQMTPPGLTPSIMYPGYLVGMDWGGVSIDADRGILIAVTNQVANYLQLISRKEADALGVTLFGSNARGGDLSAAMDIAIQQNVPYAALKAPFLSPLTVPCQEPPWSRLSAIDLSSRRILWSQPLGTGKDNGPFGFHSHLPWMMGVPAMGGSLVTASDLTFVGASTDRTFRAFQTSTGRALWETSLPESGNAAPMTYVSSEGRQIVVIAAGGHKLLHGQNGDELVAFELDPSASN